MKSIIQQPFFPCCFIGTLTMFEANIYLSILMAEKIQYLSKHYHRIKKNVYLRILNLAKLFLSQRIHREAFHASKVSSTIVYINAIFCDYKQK